MTECRTVDCCPPDDTANSLNALTELWNIADFGTGDAAAESVAEYLEANDAPAIIMAGDNDYLDPHDYASSVDAFYSEWKERGLLFPVPGNHDIDLDDLGSYFAYFTELNNQRYYSRRIGPIELFCINSGFDTAGVLQEPDGNMIGSVQYDWFVTQAARSAAPWKIVVLHHSPYSSDSTHGGTPALRWDFDNHGIDVVIGGHGHTYEHILLDGVHYIVNGLGGGAIYGFGTPVTGSIKRYNTDYGVLRITAAVAEMRLAFFSIGGVLVERIKLNK